MTLPKSIYLPRMKSCLPYLRINYFYNSTIYLFMNVESVMQERSYFECVPETKFVPQYVGSIS